MHHWDYDAKEKKYIDTSTINSPTPYIEVFFFINESIKVDWIMIVEYYIFLGQLKVENMWIAMWPSEWALTCIGNII